MATTDDKSKWDAYIQGLLQSLRELHNPNQEWTIPFVPWCGEKYWGANPRILFVGKSVGAFDHPVAKAWQTPIQVWQETGHPDTISLTGEYIKSVAAFNPATDGFWTIPLLITAAFTPREPAPHQLAGDQLTGALAWSNIYKVNANGLPSKDDLRCRCGSGFCFSHSSLRSLGREIEILRPDFVLLGIAHEWEKLAKALSIPLERGDRQFPVKLKDSEVERMIEPLKLSFAPKGIWLTHHFAKWGQNCEHARALLEMRQALDGLKSR